jgi:hypothetical protein
VQGLQEVGEVAERGVDLSQIGVALFVDPHHRLHDVAKPGSGEVGVGGADNQRTRRVGMTRAELEGDLPAVAVAADEPAIQAHGLIRTATTSASWRDDSLPLGFVARPCPRLSGVMIRKPSQSNGSTHRHMVLAANPP